MRVFIHKHESLARMKYEIESKCHNDLGQPPTFDSNNSTCALCCMYPFVHKTDMEPYRHAVTNKEASLQVECDGRNPCHRAWGAGSRSWVKSGFSLRRAPCSKSRACLFLAACETCDSSCLSVSSVSLVHYTIVVGYVLCTEYTTPVPGAVEPFRSEGPPATAGSSRQTQDVPGSLVQQQCHSVDSSAWGSVGSWKTELKGSQIDAKVSFSSL